MLVDDRPVLLCRDQIPEALLPDLDEWTPKHFEDSLKHPAVTSAASYAVVRGAFEDDTEPNRLFLYVAADMPGMVEWVDSPELRGAIEDGAERESQVLSVDGEPFTGNMYAISETRSPLGQDFVDGGSIIIERFDVPPDLVVAFDEWVASEYMDSLAQPAEVARVRAWRQNVEVPQRFPYDRYISKGSRMLSLDLHRDVPLSELIEGGVLRRWFSLSLPWRERVPYSSREAGTNLTVLRSSE